VSDRNQRLEARNGTGSVRGNGYEGHHPLPLLDQIRCFGSCRLQLNGSKVQLDVDTLDEILTGLDQIQIEMRSKHEHTGRDDAFTVVETRKVGGYGHTSMSTGRDVASTHKTLTTTGELAVVTIDTVQSYLCCGPNVFSNSAP
jgi:hypothetical protein